MARSSCRARGGLVQPADRSAHGAAGVDANEPRGAVARGGAGGAVDSEALRGHAAARGDLTGEEQTAQTLRAARAGGAPGIAGLRAKAGAGDGCAAGQLQCTAGVLRTLIVGIAVPAADLDAARAGLTNGARRTVFGPTAQRARLFEASRRASVRGLTTDTGDDAAFHGPAAF